MKLKKTENGYSMSVSRTEHEVLITLLSMYPVNTATPVVTRDQALSALTDHQQLLEAYLHEHRVNLKTLAACLLPKFPKSAKVFNFDLTEEIFEAFLQIINDVRVGSWNRLGRFDPEQNRPKLSTIADREAAWAMDTAGAVQSILLRQVES